MFPSVQVNPLCDSLLKGLTMDPSCKKDGVLHAIYHPTTKPTSSSLLCLQSPPLTDPDNTCPSSCSVTAVNSQRARAAQSCPSFSCMRSSIPLLANTQVPVICSVCHSGLGGPLPWHGWQFSRWDVGIAPVSLCPPWARSWSFNWEEAHLRLRRNMHNTLLQSLAPKLYVLQWWTGLLLAPLAGVWHGINLSTLKHSLIGLQEASESKTWPVEKIITKAFQKRVDTNKSDNSIWSFWDKPERDGEWSPSVKGEFLLCAISCSALRFFLSGEREREHGSHLTGWQV